MVLHFQGKLINLAEEVLPTGWSLQKRGYVEKYESKAKPLSQFVVIIPNLLADPQFSAFWRQVCDNAGAVVIIAENSGKALGCSAIAEVDTSINVNTCKETKLPHTLSGRTSRGTPYFNRQRVI